MTSSKLPFKSFFWAGFECTYALNEVPERIDMLAASKHDEYCRIDYNLIKPIGIKTVREGLSWHQIDKGGGVYDFSRFEKMMQIGKEERIQQIWDLNHFDFPDYLDAFSDTFVTQFGEYAKRALDVIRKYQDGTIFIAPVNEISFFSWIGASRGVWAPYKTGTENSVKFKQQLVKAAIKAMKNIWEIDKDVRFIHIDPFMRRYAKYPGDTQAEEHVDHFNTVARFEAWDMIAGKSTPELGGEPKYLDIIGVNYYFHNQEFVYTNHNNKELTFETMAWDSEVRIPFWQILKDIEERYARPMVISETGSYGDLRAQWWERTLQEVSDGLEKNMPIYGICAYPAVDRPDSVNYLERYSGLWDFESNDLSCLRVPHEKSLAVIEKFVKEHAHMGQAVV